MLLSFFFYFEIYVSNFIDRDFKFIIRIKRRAYRRYFFDQNSLLFFFISYLSSIWLSSRRKGYRVPYPNPLEFLHCVTRCQGILVRSCDPRDTFTKIPAPLTSRFSFFSLFFRGIRTPPLSVSSFSIGSDEPGVNLVPFLMQIPRLKVLGKLCMPRWNAKIDSI